MKTSAKEWIIIIIAVILEGAALGVMSVSETNSDADFNRNEFIAGAVLLVLAIVFTWYASRLYYGDVTEELYSYVSAGKMDMSPYLVVKEQLSHYPRQLAAIVTIASMGTVLFVHADEWTRWLGGIALLVALALFLRWFFHKGKLSVRKERMKRIEEARALQDSQRWLADRMKRQRPPLPPRWPNGVQRN